MLFEESADNIIVGTTTTDLPIRRTVYPSHSDPDDQRGVLLASHPWGQDAARWGALSEEERVNQAIRNVSKIHPEIVDEVEGGASHVWQNDSWAGGAFALFTPGQEAAIHDDIVSPEVAFTSQESTPRCSTRGSMEPSSPASGPRGPLTKPTAGYPGEMLTARTGSEQRNHEELLKFLRTIDREVPKGLAVHMILDNYTTHKHKNVLAWLAKHPRFQLHFTPTSSSWLNLVERWFRELTEEAVRRGSSTPCLI